MESEAAKSDFNMEIEVNGAADDKGEKVPPNDTTNVTDDVKETMNGDKDDGIAKVEDKADAEGTDSEQEDIEKAMNFDDENVVDDDKTINATTNDNSDDDKMDEIVERGGSPVEANSVKADEDDDDDVKNDVVDDDDKDGGDVGDEISKVVEEAEAESAQTKNDDDDDDTPPPPDSETPTGDPPSYNDVQEGDNEADEDAAPSPEPDEPEHIPVVTNYTPSHDYHPRLCHIKKWPDFQGYGFNLHAEKEKPGQYIGLVDADSPAEDANLRKGDRIIEVNGENMEEMNHQQVITKIKAGGDETIMLVVDTDTDSYYKNNRIKITSDLPEVIKSVTSSRTSKAMSTSTSYTPRLCHIIKWPDFQGYGFNLHAEKERGGQYIGKIDDNSPALDGGLQESDRIIEVNGVNVENETHSEVIMRIRDGGDETKLLVVDRNADKYYKNKGVTVTSSLPEVKRIQTSKRSPRPAVTNGDSYSAPKPTRVESSESTPQANGGDFLSMNLSAKEMRERLAQKKKADPKQKSNLDFKKKFEIFQKM